MYIDEVIKAVQEDKVVCYYHNGFHNDPLIVMVSQHTPFVIGLFDRGSWYPNVMVQEVWNDWKPYPITDPTLYRIEPGIKLSEIDWRHR